MSEQMTFDRKKGFVALPVEILDFDLSPGAFRTLAELCRMANTDGFCWPSLGQLSDRLGRSRSAISGYIKELRDVKLVTTEEQKMANGYNYRLKYRVTFWQSWRASLAPQVSQKNERSVQPVERPSKTKNHIHINHPARERVLEIDGLLKAWAKCFSGAPYPFAASPPTENLRAQTHSILACSRHPEKATFAQITSDLGNLWPRLGVPDPASEKREMVSKLQGLGLSPRELENALEAVVKMWPAHWRKAPTCEALMRLVKASGVTSASAKRALLAGYKKRWERAENTLRKPARSCSVAA